MSTTQIASPSRLSERLDKTAAALAPRLASLATVTLYGSLALVFLWFGAMKFTAYEAEGILPILQASPLVSFLPALLGTQGASNAIGVVELIITALLVGRLFDPRLGLLGGLGGVATFLVTLSFMASTPGVFAPEVGPLALSAGLGLFLIKDVVLLAVSAWVAAESARAIASRAGQDHAPTI